MFDFFKKRKVKKEVPKETNQELVIDNREEPKKATEEGKNAIQELLFYYFYKYMEKKLATECFIEIEKKINKDKTLLENEEFQSILEEIEKMETDKATNKDQIEKLWIKLQKVNFSIVLNKVEQ